MTPVQTALVARNDDRLSPRERARIIAEAFRKGWPFTVTADGGIEVTPPKTTPDDPFELVDMSR